MRFFRSSARRKLTSTSRVMGCLRDCLILPFGRCRRLLGASSGTYWHRVFGLCARPGAVCANDQKVATAPLVRILANTPLAKRLL